MRDLAFLDLETTGLDPARHEILEIGVVRVRGDSLAELDRLGLRVRPEHLETADPAALALNGYSDAAWADAASLSEALRRLALLLDGTYLAGHNVAFDRAFLDAAWARTGVARPNVDHHLLDTASLAWPLLTAGVVDSLSLGKLGEQLGLEGGTPHRALDDAERSLALARLLLPNMGLMTRVMALRADEHAIVTALLERIEAGRADYGPWRVDDGRDYTEEALQELLDGMAYVAAGIVRLGAKRRLQRLEQAREEA